MMYEYLKKLKADHGFMPTRILDIGAWNGFWTKNVKLAEVACVERWNVSLRSKMNRNPLVPTK